MKTAHQERLETMEPSREDVEALMKELARLREKHGEKDHEMPNLVLEEQELAEKNEGLYERAKEAINATFDYIGDKVKRIGGWIKDHPFKTALIALAAFALWYYSAPLAAGLSGIKEQGIAVTSDLLEKAINIDPTQVDVFDHLMDPIHGGPST